MSTTIATITTFRQTNTIHRHSVDKQNTICRQESTTTNQHNSADNNTSLCRRGRICRVLRRAAHSRRRQSDRWRRQHRQHRHHRNKRTIVGCVGQRHRRPLCGAPVSAADADDERRRGRGCARPASAQRADRTADIDCADARSSATSARAAATAQPKKPSVWRWRVAVAARRVTARVAGVGGRRAARTHSAKSHEPA